MPAAAPISRASSDRVFDALGNQVRRDILVRLQTRPHSVQDIADTLPVSRPAVSKHLKLLQAADLVEHTSIGREHQYRLNQRGVEVARRWLSAFWDEALDAFAQVAEGQVPTSGEHQ